MIENNEVTGIIIFGYIISDKVKLRKELEALKRGMQQGKSFLTQLRIKHILGKSNVHSELYGGSMDVEFFSASGPISIWFNQIGLFK